MEPTSAFFPPVRLSISHHLDLCPWVQDTTRFLPNMDYLVVMHSVSEIWRSLELGNIKMQGLLTPWAKRFNGKIVTENGSPTGTSTSELWWQEPIAFTCYKDDRSLIGNCFAECQPVWLWSGHRYFFLSGLKALLEQESFFFFFSTMLLSDWC